MLLFFYPTNLIWPIMAITAGGLFFRLEWARKLAIGVSILSMVAIVILFFPMASEMAEHTILHGRELWFRLCALALVEAFIFSLAVLLWQKPQTQS